MVYRMFSLVEILCPVLFVHWNLKRLKNLKTFPKNLGFFQPCVSH